jgi:hypothetical protein
MFKHATRSLTLALTLAVLTISTGRVFAPPPATTASAPTGTDPEPQGITHMILSLLGLA